MAVLHITGFSATLRVLKCVHVSAPGSGRGESAEREANPGPAVQGPQRGSRQTDRQRQTTAGGQAKGVCLFHSCGTRQIFFLGKYPLARQVSNSKCFVVKR